MLKQVTESIGNDYKVTMWAKVNTGNGWREEECDISSFFDKRQSSNVDENHISPRWGSEHYTGPSNQRPSTNMDENVISLEQGVGCKGEEEEKVVAGCSEGAKMDD